MKGPPGRGGRCPHQPSDVEAGCRDHRLQRVTVAAFEPAARHAVILLGVANRGFDRLTPTPFQPAALLRRQASPLNTYHGSLRRHAHSRLPYGAKPCSHIRRFASMQSGTLGELHHLASGHFGMHGRSRVLTVKELRCENKKAPYPQSKSVPVKLMSRLESSKELNDMCGTRSARRHLSSLGVALQAS